MYVFWAAKGEGYAPSLFFTFRAVPYTALDRIYTGIGYAPSHTTRL